MNIKKKQRGFTLIEIIIAFALFAIMMGGIYGIVLSAMNNNKAGEVKQKAALYGQEVFEDIKSGPIKQDNGDYKIGEITLEDTSGGNKSSFEGTKVFDHGYEEKVIIKRNYSIILDKEGVSSENNNLDAEGSTEKHTNDYKFYDFNFYINSSGNQVEIRRKDGGESPLTLNVTKNEPVKFSIEASADSKEKIVKIKSDDKFLTGKSEIKLNIKDDGIKLTLNFDEYKLKDFSEENRYRPVEIDVRNKEDIPLNIVLEKPEDLKVDIDNKFGKIRIFDNRSENTGGAISGELYNVKVEIMKTSGKKKSTEFKRETSQNIKFN